MRELRGKSLLMLLEYMFSKQQRNYRVNSANGRVGRQFMGERWSDWGCTRRALHLPMPTPRDAASAEALAVITTVLLLLDPISTLR